MMCSVLKLSLLEVDPPFFAFRTELHAALLAAVKLEAALGPGDVTAVASEVVVVQCCYADVRLGSVRQGSPAGRP